MTINLVDFMSHSRCADVPTSELPKHLETILLQNGKTRTWSLIDVVDGWDHEPDLTDQQYLKRTLNTAGTKTTVVYERKDS